MRTIFLAGAVLAISACGGGNDTAANEANAMAAENMMLDDNTMLDQNASIDAMTNMDANAAVDANTQNLMVQDATTNDPDTNLANGL